MSQYLAFRIVIGVRAGSLGRGEQVGEDTPTVYVRSMLRLLIYYHSAMRSMCQAAVCPSVPAVDATVALALPMCWLRDYCADTM